MIEHAPSDQAEDDYPIQHRRMLLIVSKSSFTAGKIHSLRLKYHNFVDRQGSPNQRKDIAALLELHHIYQPQLQMQRKPPAHQQRYLVSRISLSNKHCHQKIRTSGDQQWTTNMHL